VFERFVSTHMTPTACTGTFSCDAEPQYQYDTFFPIYIYNVLVFVICVILGGLAVQPALRDVGVWQE